MEDSSDNISSESELSPVRPEILIQTLSRTPSGSPGLGVQNERALAAAAGSTVGTSAGSSPVSLPTDYKSAYELLQQRIVTQTPSTSASHHKDTDSTDDECLLSSDEDKDEHAEENHPLAAMFPITRQTPTPTPPLHPNSIKSNSVGNCVSSGNIDNVSIESVGSETKVFPLISPSDTPPLPRPPSRGNICRPRSAGNIRGVKCSVPIETEKTASAVNQRPRSAGSCRQGGRGKARLARIINSQDPVMARTKSTSNSTATATTDQLQPGSPTSGASINSSDTETAVAEIITSRCGSRKTTPDTVGSTPGSSSRNGHHRSKQLKNKTTTDIKITLQCQLRKLEKKAEQIRAKIRLEETSKIKVRSSTKSKATAAVKRRSQTRNPDNLSGILSNANILEPAEPESEPQETKARKISKQESFKEHLGKMSTSQLYKLAGGESEESHQTNVKIFLPNPQTPSPVPELPRATIMRVVKPSVVVTAAAVRDNTIAKTIAATVKKMEKLPTAAGKVPPWKAAAKEAAAGEMNIRKMMREAIAKRQNQKHEILAKEAEDWQRRMASENLARQRADAAFQIWCWWCEIQQQKLERQARELARQKALSSRIIQRVWRGKLGRDIYKQERLYEEARKAKELERRTLAAIIIQKVIRGVQASRWWKSEKQRLIERRVFIMTKVKNLNLQRTAAMQIQSLWRMYATRKYYTPILLFRLRFCAVKLQRSYREVLRLRAVEEHIQRYYTIRDQSVIRIQTAWRGCIASRELHYRFTKRDLFSREKKRSNRNAFHLHS